MGAQSFRLYITEWAPDGTSDLIVTDRFDNVLQVVNEAVFGLKGDFKYDLMFDEIYLIETYQNAECPIARVSLGQVLAHVAVSPTSSGADLIDALRVAGGAQ